MLVDDVRSLDDGVARGHGTVGLDLEDETIVVGATTDAAVLNDLGAATDGREERVDVNDADGIGLTLVILAGDVAATHADAHPHGEVGALGEGADDVARVDDLELSGDIEVAAGHRHGAVDRDGGLRLGAGAHGAEDQALDVEHDVGDVLVDALNGRELMLHAVDGDGLDCSALEGREQHATQGVAQRIAVATLQRLDVDASQAVADLLYRHLRSDEIGHCYLQTGSGLLGVELDDELSVNVKVDLVTGRELKDGALELLDVDLEPAGDGHVLGGDQGLLDGEKVLVLGGDGNNVAGLDLSGGDVAAVAVHGDVTVTDGLTGLLAGAGEAKTEDDVVETALEDAHQVVAGDALTLESGVVVAVELLLENAIDELGLLLLAKLHTVLGLLAATLGLAVRSLVNPHHNGVDAELTAPLKDGSPINCHC